LNKEVITKSVLYAFYILSVLHLVFISGNDHRHLDLFSFENTFAYLPFQDKYQFFASGEIWSFNNSKFFAKEVFGNLLLLAPLAVILLIEGVRSTRKIVFITFLSSFSIELVQYISGIGHADVDDLILNTSGAFVGIFAVRLVARWENWLQLVIASITNHSQLYKKTELFKHTLQNTSKRIAQLILD
jgi:glycopeptide antibiotics resistance protein